MNLHVSLYCLGLRSRKRRFTAACGSLLKVEPTFLCAHRGRAYCPHANWHHCQANAGFGLIESEVEKTSRWMPTPAVFVLARCLDIPVRIAERW